MMVAFLVLKNTGRVAGAQLRTGGCNDAVASGAGKRRSVLTCVRLRAVAKSRVADSSGNAFDRLR
jgi:hypothetical protein